VKPASLPLLISGPVTDRKLILDLPVEVGSKADIIKYVGLESSSQRESYDP